MSTDAQLWPAIRGVWGFAGKTVAVVGGTSGIGAAFVQIAADDGASVLNLARRPSDVPGVEQLSVDLRDPNSIEAAVDALQKRRIDVLVVPAGVGWVEPPMDVLTVNFLGPRAIVAGVAAVMEPGAAIVVVSSLADVAHPSDDELLRTFVESTDLAAGRALAESEPRLRELAYSFSKTAVRQYTVLHAPTFMKRGIRLNCVTPNVTDTPMIVPTIKERPHALDLWMPCIDRFARPDEPASAIAFLASDRASYIAGINIVVDAGTSAAMDIGLVERPVVPARAVS